jgi:hypothetical protein
MTSDSSSIYRRYSFGPYTLDPMRRLLRHDGALMPLTPKTVDVLSALVERHGTVVAKDDLLRFVWPNAVVEENNLPRQVSILRKALQQRRGQLRVGRPLHGSPERGRVYRGVPIESGLDCGEILQQLDSIDQATIEHFPDVTLVLRMPALDLRQGLCIEVEMTEGQMSFLGDERASVLPAVPDRDEIIWRGELDIDLQAFLDLGDGPKHAIEVGHHFHVDIDGALTPAVEDGCRPARQVHLCALVRFAAQRLHELLYACRVC